MPSSRWRLDQQMSLPVKSRQQNRKPHAPVRLPDQECLFDKKTVPDDQLIACCYWEYARESALIRDAVAVAKRAAEEERTPGPETEARAEFRAKADKACELLLRTGYDLAFWVGLPFPEPWQAVPGPSRKHWAGIRPRTPAPPQPAPFQATSDVSNACELARLAAQAHEKRLSVYAQIVQNEEGPGDQAIDAELRRQLQAEGSVRLLGAGGVETIIAQVNWRQFNDREILMCFKQWLATNRPCGVAQDHKGEKGSKSGPGRSPKQWRASLERLVIMRQMRCMSHKDLACAAPDSLRDREKFEKAECRKEREKARRDFRELFPWLNDEQPLSWATLPGEW